MSTTKTSKAKSPKQVKPVDPVKEREAKLKQAYLVCFYAAINDLEATVEQKAFHTGYCEHYENMIAPPNAKITGLKAATVVNGEIPQYFRVIFDEIVDELSDASGDSYVDKINETEEGSMSRLSHHVGSTTNMGKTLKAATDFRNEIMTMLPSVTRDNAFCIVSTMLTILKGFAKVAASLVWHGKRNKPEITVKTETFLVWFAGQMDGTHDDFFCKLRKSVRPKIIKKAEPAIGSGNLGQIGVLQAQTNTLDAAIVDDQKSASVNSTQPEDF